MFIDILKRLDPNWKDYLTFSYVHSSKEYFVELLSDLDDDKLEILVIEIKELCKKYIYFNTYLELIFLLKVFGGDEDPTKFREMKIPGFLIDVDSWEYKDEASEALLNDFDEFFGVKKEKLEVNEWILNQDLKYKFIILFYEIYEKSKIFSQYNSFWITDNLDNKS